MESDTVTFEDSTHSDHRDITYSVEHTDVTGHKLRPVNFMSIGGRYVFVQVMREFMRNCQKIPRYLATNIQRDYVRSFPFCSVAVTEISITYRDGRRLVIAAEAPDQPAHSRLGE